MAQKLFSATEIDRIIEMAWEDRTTFEAIEIQFGLKQQDVIKLMRKEMKPSSFKMWRERTKGRNTKHEALRKMLLVEDSNLLREVLFDTISTLKNLSVEGMAATQSKAISLLNEMRSEERRVGKEC